MFVFAKSCKTKQTSAPALTKVTPPPLSPRLSSPSSARVSSQHALSSCAQSSGKLLDLLRMSDESWSCCVTPRSVSLAIFNPLNDVYLLVISSRTKGLGSSQRRGSALSFAQSASLRNSETSSRRADVRLTKRM